MRNRMRFASRNSAFRCRSPTGFQWRTAPHRPARELRNDAIARAPEDPAGMVRDQAVDDRAIDLKGRKVFSSSLPMSRL